MGKRKKERSLFGFLALFFFIGILILPWKTDGNLESDVFAAGVDEAETLSTNGTWVNGYIAKGEENYYKVRIPKAGYLTVTFQGKSLGSGYFMLYNDTQTKTYYSEFFGGASETSPATKERTSVLEAGTYYVKVKGYEDRYYGSYSLKISFRSANNNEVEPNNSFSEAEKIAFEQKVEGLISCDDLADYYVIQVPSSGYLTVTFQGKSLGSGYFILYNDTQTKTYYSEFFGGASETSPATKERTSVLEAGTYYVKVKGYEDRYHGSYSLKLSFHSAGNNDIEPNNTVSEAQQLTIGKETRGLITEDDAVDFYRIVIPSRKAMTLELKGKSLSPSYYTLYNADQTSEYFNEHIYRSSNDTPKVLSREQELDPGTYYLKVSGDGTGEYSVKISDPSQKPEDSQKTNKNTQNNNTQDSRNTQNNGNNIRPPRKGTWKMSASGWWYENPDGTYPADGWTVINGRNYYFNAYGYMESDCYVNGYWLDAAGVYTSGSARGAWYCDAGGWYYMDETGWYPVSRWLKIDGNWYYFDARGYMGYNEYQDGYWIGPDGIMTAYPRGSWYMDAYGWYFKDTSGWYPVSAWYYINGSWYYFNGSGYWIG